MPETHKGGENSKKSWLVMSPLDCFLSAYVPRLFLEGQKMTKSTFQLGEIYHMLMVGVGRELGSPLHMPSPHWYLSFNVFRESERKGRREGEKRERNIIIRETHWLVASPRRLNQVGIKPATQMHVLDWESVPQPFCAWADTLITEKHWPGQNLQFI